MGLLDRILGRQPKDPQEERVEARTGEEDEAVIGPPDEPATASTPAEAQQAAEIRRDEEAARHQGI